MIAVGDYVIDGTAKRAEETGSSEDVGVGGLVHGVTVDHLDTATGEIGDLLHVATRHHGTLGFAQLNASAVAEHWPCGRMDAAGFVSLAQRFIARVAAKKQRADARAIEVLALATAIKDDTRHPQIGRTALPSGSVFPTDDDLADHDARTGGEGRLRNPAALAAALAADVDRRRTERSAS